MQHRHNGKRTARSVLLQSNTLGVIAASAVMAALLAAGKVGEPTPPSLKVERFSVAVLAGPKQAAQTAPADVSKTEEAVAPTPAPETVEVAAAERSTSLPEAVAATPDSNPGPEVATPVEVIPPATVSMPGGQLMAQDAPVGELSDPFAIGPQQVFIRLFVNEQGKVVRGGIVRGGTEPMRDAFILKAMLTRNYSTKNLIRIEGNEPLWQLDMVIDYGTNEYLP